MLEKWNSTIGKNKVFGTLLTYLLKAFDCISRELIIAKLNDFIFFLLAHKVIGNCLANWKQRAKISNLSW